MAINTEKLGMVLQNFVSATNDIQGAAVVTPDGLPLADCLPGGMDDERVAAMSEQFYLWANGLVRNWLVAALIGFMWKAIKDMPS